MVNPSTIEPVTVFFSYSHKDEKLRDRLAANLAILQRKGLIKSWHDREISAGTEWKKAIDNNLNTADIILLLISADFINSDYCWDVEMKRAIARHEAGEARVIPIILQPVNLSDTPFGKLQALPQGARPVTKYRNYEHAFYDIVQGIRKTAEEISQRRQPIVPPKARQTDSFSELMKQIEFNRRLAELCRSLSAGENTTLLENNTPHTSSYDSPSQHESNNPWLDWRFITIIASVVFGAILMASSQNLSIRKLHEAAQVWDINLARQGIAELKSSGDTCKSQLGSSVEGILNRYGSQGLNMVQGMQTHLEKTTTCKYPSVLNAPDQIPYERLKFN